ncbi:MULTISPECIES: formylglycine-generating enzyme family protein [Tsukamurella]|uniref:Formylglycine-generating enzyme family protein n=2 Tax=Tsukamurella TaxID=2060 RepID=A0A5C5S3S7_9ACTN|nr:formylglycine-generating enzyme family protein [Tsukamurella columbiensis]TWS30057.1 formylglycine-generating enzyme family protein [Tsukamurella conjunctivitidis]
MSCCTPEGPDLPPHTGAVPGGGAHPIAQARIPAGAFAMGDAHGDGYRADGELPVHRVALPGFTIDATTVTVAAFAAFADATGYVTDAERYGSSAVFHASAARHREHGERAESAPPVGLPVPGTPWWLTVPDATFRAPGGPGTVAHEDHPVVHVSHADALAYCAWTGRALPTEAQWEYAARGGLAGARYPWGDEHPVPGRDCNIFVGAFPQPDGAVGTVAARSYAPNGYGLYQAVGNVWEWCADRYSAHYYRRSPERAPHGPDRGTARVLRGGSHLCHDSYCYRYRVAARSHTTPSSSAGNIGFRTVSDSDVVIA